MTVAAVILCGGKSTRMGRPKALLPFGNETMLQRVAGRVLQSVDLAVVVAAGDQSLPELPANTRVVRDEADSQGPLEGIRVGLLALPETCEAAFVCSCDAPWIAPQAVAWLIERLDDQHAIVVPHDGKYHHPLFAVYRRDCAATIAELLADGQRRPVFLFDRLPTKQIHVHELREADPDLDSFINVNTPEAYQEQLRRLSS